MSDFNSFYQRHLMGRAYRRITAQMGPSLQLLAFLNYDNVTPDSLGLESFNIMSQHEQILDYIESDQSGHVAIEGLLTVLWSKKIPLHSEFSSYEKFHAHTVGYIKSVLSKVPTKPDLKAWQDFHKHVKETEESYFDDLAKTGTLIQGAGAKSLEEAGWTKTNFDAATAWTQKALQSSHDAVELWKQKSESTKQVIEQAGEDKAKIEAVFKNTFHQMYGMDASGAGSAHQAEALLKRIAPQIKADKK